MIRELAFLCLAGQTFAAPEIPRGVLSVDSTLVRVGSPSQLTWKIQYPAVVDLTPEKDMKMRVRIVGSSFQKTKNNNGNGNNVDGVDSSNPGAGGKTSTTIDPSAGIDDEKTGSITSASALDLPFELVWSKNGSPWQRLFYGTRSSVVPTAIVLNTQVAKGDKIDFGARGYQTSWLPLYSTAAATPNLVILTNGEPLPTNISAFRLNQIKGFLKAYLTSDGKTLKIGERDLLILVELDQTDPSSAGFDLQDLAVLVTFD